jgi:hypothetical protein
MAGTRSNIEIATGTITTTAAGTEIETIITTTTITKNVANGLHLKLDGVTDSGTILLSYSKKKNTRLK